MTSAFSVQVDIDVGLFGTSVLDTLASRLDTVLASLNKINSMGMRGFSESVSAISTKLGSLDAQLDRVARPRTAYVNVRQTGGINADSTASRGTSSSYAFNTLRERNLANMSDVQRSINNLTGVATDGIRRSAQDSAEVFRRALSPSALSQTRAANDVRFSSGGGRSSEFRWGKIADITAAGFAISELTHVIGGLGSMASHVQQEMTNMRLMGFSEAQIAQRRTADLVLSGKTYGSTDSEIGQTRREIGGLIGSENVTDKIIQSAYVLQQMTKAYGTPETLEQVKIHVAQIAETGDIKDKAGNIDSQKFEHQLSRLLAMYAGSGGTLSTQTLAHITRGSQIALNASGMDEETRDALIATTGKRKGDAGADMINNLMAAVSEQDIEKNGRLMGILNRVHPGSIDRSKQTFVIGDPASIHGGTPESISGGIFRPAGLSNNPLERADFLFDSIKKMADITHMQTDHRAATEHEVWELGRQERGPEKWDAIAFAHDQGMRASLKETKDMNKLAADDPSGYLRKMHDPTKALQEFTSKLENVVGEMVVFSHAIDILDFFSAGLQKAAVFFNSNPWAGQAVSAGAMGIMGTAAIAAVAYIGNGIKGILSSILGLGPKGASAARAAASIVPEAAIAGESAIATEGVAAGVTGIVALGSKFLRILPILGKGFLIFEAISYGLSLFSSLLNSPAVKWLLAHTGGTDPTKTSPNGPSSAAEGPSLLGSAFTAGLFAFEVKQAVSMIGWLGKTSLLQATSIGALATAIGSLAIPITAVVGAVYGISKLKSYLDSKTGVGVPAPDWVAKNAPSWLTEMLGGTEQEYLDRLRKKEGKDIPTMTITPEAKSETKSEPSVSDDPNKLPKFNQDNYHTVASPRHRPIVPTHRFNGPLPTRDQFPGSSLHPTAGAMFPPSIGADHPSGALGAFQGHSAIPDLQVQNIYAQNIIGAGGAGPRAQSGAPSAAHGPIEQMISQMSQGSAGASPTTSQSMDNVVDMDPGLNLGKKKAPGSDWVSPVSDMFKIHPTVAHSQPLIPVAAHPQPLIGAKKTPGSDWVMPGSDMFKIHPTTPASLPVSPKKIPGSDWISPHSIHPQAMKVNYTTPLHEGLGPAFAHHPATSSPSFTQGGTFAQKAKNLVPMFMKELGLNRNQAAAVVGNLGYESAGLQPGIQEKNPRYGRGGLGYAQWTGPRRDAFLKFSKDHHLDPKSDQANIDFALSEMKGSHAYAINALKKTHSLAEGVRVFEEKYERASVKNFASRDNYAQQAMAASANSMSGNPQQSAMVANQLAGPRVTQNSFENMPTASHHITLNHTTHLDGEVIAENTMRRMIDSSPAGLSGMTGFDPRMMPLPPGTSIR